MKCHQCNQPAMYIYGPGEIPLCLNCYQKIVQLTLMQDQMYQRRLEQIEDNMADIVGVPRKQRPAPITQVLQKPAITYINIDRSQIGVVNTGTIGNLNATISYLEQTNQKELSGAIISLAQAVLKNNEIENELKNNLVEIINAISAEAAKPKQSRPVFIAKILLSKLSELIKTSAALTQVWEKVGPIIESVFK